jgi:hypothetical protein
MDTVSSSKEAHSIDEKMEDQGKIATEYKEGGLAGWGTVVGAYITPSFHAIPLSHYL